MSYDYPDDYVHPPEPKCLTREWLVDRYWRFVIWCALDAKSERLNRIGLRMLDGRPQGQRRHARILYTNHRGVTEWRRISPHVIYFGSTKFHPEAQWLLRAYCHTRREDRDFALIAVHEWR